MHDQVGGVVGFWLIRLAFACSVTVSCFNCSAIMEVIVSMSVSATNWAALGWT
jgi:hypothetical protein